MSISLDAMELFGENLLFFRRYKWALHSLYWVLAAFLLFFVFSSGDYDLTIRVMVVLTLTIMSLGLTYFINYYLIPRFLFFGKYFQFFYSLVYSVMVSVWVNYLAILYIIWFNANHSPSLMFPGNKDVVLLISGSYIIILFAAIIHFIKETYKRLMERDRIARQKSETELRLKEAKLKLLQGQLHPHFLFNMLNNLYGLWMENSKSTPEIILKLSNLLEFMLYECEQERISLSKEIQFIRSYIDLEILRHDSRLKLEINLPEGDSTCSISPLILFCFVENAFKHGANKNSGESNIAITLIRKDHFVELTVINNFSAVTLSDPKDRNGIGLRNVEERLDMLYPNKHQLEIGENNGLFRVWLQLETE